MAAPSPSRRSSDRESPAPGIRWDESRGNWIVAVEVGAGRARRAGAARLTAKTRFPAGSTLREMRAWQDAARVELRAERHQAALEAAEAAATRPAPEVLTLQQAADAYLATVTAMPSYDSRRHDLYAWVRHIGPDTPVDAIAEEQLAAAWNEWKEAGYAAWTLIHRRTALLRCARLKAKHLVPLIREGLVPPRPPKDVPREWSQDEIAEVFRAMGRSRSRAMLRVFAATGFPPATQRRLLPDDVDLEAATVRLATRAKGDTVAGVVLPLTPAGVAAFQEFAAANAWGGVRTHAVRTAWYRALTKANKRREAERRRPIPAFSPYALRHSFAGLVLDATGGDLQALQELLQHADIRTSLKYVKARASRAATAAARAIANLQPD